MLHHFLLIFPTRFEGVLATYGTPISSYFPHRDFGGASQDDDTYTNKRGLGGVLGFN